MTVGYQKALSVRRSKTELKRQARDSTRMTTSLNS